MKHVADLSRLIKSLYLKSGALFVIALVMTTYYYGTHALTDYGYLYISDDATLISRTCSQIWGVDLLRSHVDHIMAVPVLYYKVIFGLVGFSWKTYGTILLISHTILAWLVAHIIFMVGRSFIAAVAVMLPFATSLNLLLGPLDGFNHTSLYLITICSLSCLYLISRRDAPYGNLNLLAITVAAAVAMFTTAAGVTVFVAIAGGWLVFWLLRAGSRRANQRFFDAQFLDPNLLLVTLALVSIFIGAYAYGVLSLGNPVPGTASQAGAPPRLDMGIFVRAVRWLESNYMGSVFLRANNEFLSTHSGIADLAEGDFILPFSVHVKNATTIFIPLILVSLGVSIASFWKTARFPDTSRAGALTIVCLIYCMSVALIEVSGRSHLVFVFRYTVFITTFSAVAIGLTLAILYHWAAARQYRGLFVVGTLLVSLSGFWTNHSALPNVVTEFIRKESAAVQSVKPYLKSDFSCAKSPG